MCKKKFTVILSFLFALELRQVTVSVGLKKSVDQFNVDQRNANAYQRDANERITVMLSLQTM